MTDAPKPLTFTSPPTEDQLVLFERLLANQAAEPETDNVSAQLALQLLAEIRRLHQLLVDIEPTLPRSLTDGELLKRLKAEVGRG